MTAIYLEVGTKKTFACAVEWPGWCRSGKNADAAIAALVEYAPRYAVVAECATLTFPGVSREDIDIVEQISGSATTDFGAPGAVPLVDTRPCAVVEAKRIASVVTAAWVVFDRVVATAPAVLHKGRRGGGRDRDKMVEHVISAEVMYARKLGVIHAESLRDSIVAGLETPSNGMLALPHGWPPRYAARRIAWHVLDHAWEMEDRGII